MPNYKHGVSWRVNSTLGRPELNSMSMGKPKAGTITARPLFLWFSDNKERRRKMVEAGFSHGRISNWKRRGIPRAEIGQIAAFMGLAYEDYLERAGIDQPNREPALTPDIGEAHAIRALRRALPAYRNYVLSLAMIDSHEKQQLLLDVMQETVPDRRVEVAYGKPGKRR